MPLGIDATIRYSENNWTRPLHRSELERDGPYNTRTRRGLPPTPIGNPGLASIRAAARPSHANYLYYVRKPGESGAHAFSSSESRFLRDVRRYQDSGGAG
jgi:cell division protein YceG involved in septum cleavage